MWVREDKNSQDCPVRITINSLAKLGENRL